MTKRRKPKQEANLGAIRLQHHGVPKGLDSLIELLLEDARPGKAEKPLRIMRVKLYCPLVIDLSLFVLPCLVIIVGKFGRALQV